MGGNDEIPGPPAPTNNDGDFKQAGPTGGGSSQRQGMLAVNDLNYILPPDLSVSVNNTYKNHFFQSNQYTHTQRGICILNSGADYGDLRCSSLNFQTQMTTTLDKIGYFGKNGSVLNLIRSITISSRSGDEISRVTDLNHLNVMTNGFRYSKNWVETVGQSMGYGECMLPYDAPGVGIQQWSIPLYLLSDFFSYGRLMPSMVLAGLRIEIEWETPDIAMQTVEHTVDTAPAVAIAGYSIINPYIALRSVQLTDGTQRSLNEMSAVNGLEIVYCDHERTEQSLNGVAVNLEVRKAASRALKAYVSTRTTNGDEYKRDSFYTEPWLYTQWQWQLGSLYFPQQPIKATIAAHTIPESYQHTLVAFHTYKGDQSRTSAVPMRNNTNFLKSNIAEVVLAADEKFDLPQGLDYAVATELPWAETDNARAGIVADSNGRAGTFANGRSTISCLLERSDLFNLTGVPINNSRVLAFQAQYSGAAANRKVTIFLKYVRLARVFLNNVEVEQ